MGEAIAGHQIVSITSCVRFMTANGTLEKKNLKTETSAHSRQANASACAEALLQHVTASELHPRLRWAPLPAQAGFRSALLPTRFRTLKERSFDIGTAVQVAWIFVQANNQQWSAKLPGWRPRRSLLAIPNASVVLPSRRKPTAMPDFSQRQLFQVLSINSSAHCLVVPQHRG